MAQGMANPIEELGMLSELVKLWTDADTSVKALTIGSVLSLGLLRRQLGSLRDQLRPLLKLRQGLAARKIAILTSTDAQATMLRNLLVDSRLFSAGNMETISSKKELGRAQSKGVSVYLMFWPDWKTDFAAVLQQMHDQDCLIVYAPPADGRIGEAEMQQLETHRHVVVTNFRGRLLNDILITMMTTGGE
jgi:hypothetical protein